MIVDERKKHGIILKETWLAKEMPDKADIIIYHFAKKRMQKTDSCGYDLMTDLQREDEIIFSEIYRNTKNEIRRGEREGIICRFLSGDDLNNAYLSHYVNTLFAFEESKNRKIGEKESILKRLQSYRDKNLLLVSEAVYKGEVIVWHSYLLSAAYREAILFQSFSLYRTEPEKRKLVGYGNRLLHWKDICYLKEKGYEKYNWGGYNEDLDELKNISSFKEKFGGRKIQVYDGVQAKTLKGKLAWIFLTLKNNIRKRNERIKSCQYSS